MIAIRGGARKGHRAVADYFVAGAEVLIAVQSAALGALTAARSLAACKAAESPSAALSCLTSVDHVVAKVGDLLLTETARADLLVVFEQKPVLGAKAAAAVLA
jgi:hypothetical protein